MRFGDGMRPRISQDRGLATAMDRSASSAARSNCSSSQGHAPRRRSTTSSPADIVEPALDRPVGGGAKSNRSQITCLVREFDDFRCGARDVLYVDGEMPQQALQERLLGLTAADEYLPEDAFRLLCIDRQELGASLNLADPKHQKLIDHHVETTDLLVLDNMSTLMNGGPENDAESWISMQAWLLQLRRRGVTVLVVHHASRGGNARGTSKRDDVLDTIVQLKHPDGYDPAEGARLRCIR